MAIEALSDGQTVQLSHADWDKVQQRIARLEFAVGFAVETLEKNYLGLPTSAHPGPPSTLVTFLKDSLNN